MWKISGFPGDANGAHTLTATVATSSLDEHASQGVQPLKSHWWPHKSLPKINSSVHTPSSCFGFGHVSVQNKLIAKV